MVQGPEVHDEELRFGPRSHGGASEGFRGEGLGQTEFRRVLPGGVGQGLGGGGGVKMRRPRRKPWSGSWQEMTVA